VIGLIFYKRFSFDLAQYLARRNSIHRFNLRQIEKNRFPHKCQCVVCGEHFLCRGIEEYLQRKHYRPDKDGNVQHVCWGCDLQDIVGRAAETLFHLISAVPQWERDSQKIYPGHFCKARITPPPWDWRTPYGLRDYSEPTRLLSKFGEYEFAYRQIGGPVWTGRDSHVALWVLGQLKTPDEQRTLKRVGRLYLNSCWRPKRDKSCLFDRCQALSWQKLLAWKPGQRSIQLESPDTVKFAELVRVAKSGGQVEILGPPAKRHAQLAATRQSYNDQWPSYWNLGTARRKSDWDFGIRSPKNGIAGMSETLRELGSPNIPHETIELRNNMVANLERDFGRRDETKAA